MTDAGGKRIGQVLIEAGLITEVQLAEALEMQQREGGRICSNLVRLGFLSADDLLRFLSGQFGVAALNIAHYRIPATVLALLPADLARRRRVVPLNVFEGNLTLAMEDPRDASAVEEVERATGLKVDPLITPSTVLQEALRRYYAADEGAPGGGGRKVLSLDEKSDHPAVFDAREAPGDLSPLNWLKRIIFLAIKKRSREVHLEPREGDMALRFRVGQRLVAGEDLPSDAGRGIADVLLAYGGCGAAGSCRAREGWLTVKVKNHDLKLIFSIFPVIHGRRTLIRLADEGLLKRPLREQGMSEAEERGIRGVLAGRKGLYLVAAPAAQQRRWMMYQLIELVHDEGTNVFTVEPQVLFPLAGVNQTVYADRRGCQRHEVLEAALRQEPDVLGLADLDDPRLVDGVWEASSRSLVIGTMPLADTGEALAWLQREHRHPLALAHLLLGILSVRFVPALCPRCRRPMSVKMEMIEGTRDMKPEEMKFQEAPGCEHCERTGRMGQIGLFESLIVDGEVRDLLAAETPAKVVHEEAQRRGMRTIFEDGLAKAARGEVDPRDVLRVIPPRSA